MTTHVIIASPDTNAHRISVIRMDRGKPVEDHTLKPGAVTEMHIGEGGSIIVTESLEKHHADASS
jgi:hypothetical protein